MSANQIERDRNLGLSTLRVALGAAYRQTGGIDPTCTRTPVNVLMRNFAILETDDDGYRHLHALPRRRDAGQEPVHRRRVREAMKSSSTT